MNLNPYQCAVSVDVELPTRKWDHRGTFWSYSHRDAAFAALKDDPTARNVVREFASVGDGVVFEFDNGVFVRVL